jgi:hypothetical protein
MMELAMKTITADTTIGSHNANKLVMSLSLSLEVLVRMSGRTALYPQPSCSVTRRPPVRR